MSTAASTAQKYAEISKIIQGKPAASLSRLPSIWLAIDDKNDESALSPAARRDYVEAAQRFRFHDTPLAMEALSAIGYDFDKAVYPDFVKIAALATTEIAQKTVRAVEELFTEFGYDVPASFYN